MFTFIKHNCIQMFKDKKLELYLSKLNESTNVNDKMSNYKKAMFRINELKIKYNNLNESLKKNKQINIKNKKISNDKININNLIDELEDIDKKMNNSNDIADVIDNYLQCKLLLDNLESEAEKFKNEITQVSQNGKKIKITRIDPENIL